MYVDETDGLIDYWRDFPPAHILVRGAVGYKSPKGDAPMSAAQLAAEFGGKVVRRG